MKSKWCCQAFARMICLIITCSWAETTWACLESASAVSRLSPCGLLKFFSLRAFIWTRRILPYSDYGIYSSMQNACFPEMLQRQVMEIFILYTSVYSHNLNACFCNLCFSLKFFSVSKTKFIASSATLLKCRMWCDLPQAESDHSAYHN